MHRIRRRLIKLRFQPIRVLCFHQVSDVFDDKSMYAQDWLQTEEFKTIITKFQQKGYAFISLDEAHERLKHERFRCKKYVVLTADDGWASIKNILPWLNERHIPVTLFMNPSYFDGKHFRIRATERYLTQKEVEQLHAMYPLLTIGSHGWEHVSATMMTEQAFTENVVMSIKELGRLPNYIPYFAYTWGLRNDISDKILRDFHLVQVNTKGRLNYNVCNPIDREILTSDISI